MTTKDIKEIATTAQQSGAAVLRFPTRRKAAYRQPVGAMNRKCWGENVQPIRPPQEAREKVVIPATAFLFHALLTAQALKRPRKGGASPMPAGIMDVQAALSSMMARLQEAGDIEAAAGAYAAMDLLWSSGGRW